MGLDSAQYPWHHQQWQQIGAMIAQGRLPHALMIGGLAGLGKLAFAQRLAGLLLCQRPAAGDACGQCKPCLLMAANSHPDYKLLQAEEVGKAILVDQVRKLQVTLANTAQQGGARVVVINAATQLNLNAANALLKQLEEPGDNCYFLLLHQWPKPVLPTVRSRCQMLDMAMPSKSQALEWLKQHMDDAAAIQVLPLAKGAPLQALALYQDKAHELRHQMLVQLTAILRGQQSSVEVAQSWQKLPLIQAFTWWLEWLNDLVKLKLTEDVSCLANADLEKLLQAVAKRSDIAAIYGLLDQVTLQLNYLHQRRNLNPQLVCEELLNGWYLLVRSGKLK
jgi:DNA polymerase-3 subunit delta'